MVRVVLVLAIAASGCGRFGFDDVPDGGGDASVDAFEPQSGPWAQVFSRGNTLCAVKEDGTAWCAGNNVELQIGAGSEEFAVPPTKLPGTWRTLAVGRIASCGLQLDSTLWCWGDDSFGGVPDGTTVSTHELPTQIGTDTDWLEVVVGDRHGCARKQDSTLWCWGDNGSRQFDPSVPASTTPMMVRANVRTMSAYALVTSVVDNDGSLWITGQTFDGEGGTDQFGAGYSNYTRVGTDNDWRSVTAGPNRTCAIKSNGTMWCTGRGVFGALGNNTESSSATFVKVASGATWIDATVGFDHVCGRQQDSTAWCWGASSRGQFAVPVRSTVPSMVASVRSIAAGDAHTCFATPTGVLRCAGSNHSAQIRFPPATSLAPTTAGGPYARLISTYDNSVCVQDAMNLVSCWGANDAGQLGTNGVEWHQQPKSLGGGWLQLSVGNSMSVGIIAGQLYWWGTNDNTGTFQGTPAVTGIFNDFIEVAAGAWHACALRAGGELYCWGANDRGQLGVGDFVGRDDPTLAGTGFTQVAAGKEHTCGVQGGTLRCWGDNFFGSVGDGSGTNQPSPTDVMCPTCGARTVSKLALGDAMSYALMNDGTLFAWGVNQSGQLGIGTLVGSDIAVQSATGRTWADVEVGDMHVCAIENIGRMWCWGHGDEGQLGDGTLDTAAPTPRAVGTDTDWTDVAIGYHASCALKSSGMRYCWGANHSGIYGDGLSWFASFVAIAGEQ